MNRATRVYRVACRNVNCSYSPPNFFEFEPEEVPVFLGPSPKVALTNGETWIVTCPACGWEKRIMVRRGDPDDRIY